MGFDKRKELYWAGAILLSTLITGILVFGEALWDGQPVDIQLHDTYFVLTKTLFLVVVFIVLAVVVYGCRAVLSSSSIVLKIVAGILVVIVIGTLITIGNAVYWLHQQAAVAPVEERWEGKFSLVKYPSDRYNINYDTIEVDSFRVVLIICLNTGSSLENTGDVWMRCLVGDSITEKYIGPLESEAGVWIPDPQPIPKMFMAIQCGEFDGVINLVSKKGEFISFPGRYYAVDEKNRMYTTFAEYDTLVYAYDLTKGSGESLLGKHMLHRDLVFQGGGANGYWVK
ncbi:hypothetical protein [Parachryseolinea silvisoli]|uniref:hypothetical protein n=1 Tax=Parachryseolinea silvisoli TaxID=2873601 RepID=UPI002265B4DB|nr:hypothetical protein [Parachryseolinea silvisoli]MCD9018456.1 hypothetical protein [Parachryseolinea silvisoli]